MLIDKVEVILKGGDGGHGKVSFVKIGRGPDGGNGGDGGDLYVVASSDLTLLNQFSRETEISAERGIDGGRNKKTGHNGADLDLILPVGTSIISKKTGELILELTKVGERKLLCEGGRGGRGNWEFRSSRNTTPKTAEKGQKGVLRKVILNLKLIADFGLIGLPNAGKSSLLNELTNAKAQIANYQFTTLSPNLGIFEKRVIADIPGLIEGASEGRGLGVGFLKHIEKVKMLIHCVSCDSQDPLHDYQTVKNELKAFNAKLGKKDEVILLTKSDLIENERLKEIMKKFKNKSKNILTVSIYDPDSIDEVKNLLISGN